MTERSVSPAPLPAGYRLVDVPFERRAEIVDVVQWAFASGMDLEQREKVGWPISFDRTRAVERDGELVAFHTSYGFPEHPVPGGEVPVSGLTWVSVHPGHRRRGLLRAMVHDHLARSLARREPVSMLWAAEMGIYGRFGYGLAARSLALEIPRRASLRPVPGSQEVTVRLEKLDPATHLRLFQDLHARVTRPGWTRRSTPGLEATALADPEFARNGAEPMRVAIAERDGEPVAMARFRRRAAWEPTGPQGTVEVRECVSHDAAATHALWSTLLDLDLTATVEVSALPLDDPLLALLVDWPAASPRLQENLWVRLLDLPTALEARRYAAPVDLVLEVTDALVAQNAGRWRLVGDREGAEVTRTQEPAHLALDVRDLGAAFLGGVPLAQLAGAGLVTELAPGTLHPASTAFGWPLAPTAPFIW